MYFVIKGVLIGSLVNIRTESLFWVVKKLGTFHHSFSVEFYIYLNSGEEEEEEEEEE